MQEKNLEQIVLRAVKYLKGGGIIAFPTETVYGIGCLSDKPEAIKKLITLKKRKEKPFQLLFPYKNMIKDYCNIQNIIELKIIKRLMPGPITLLLEKRKELDQHILQKSPFIGARIANNKIIEKILQQLDSPLVSTSANISGEKDMTSAQAVEKVFGNDIPLIIDGGTCSGEKPSTVIKVENNEITIVRPGQLEKREITEILKN